MARIFFGKISKKYPEQLKNNFYAAGPEGTPWYGGIKPGDYVFPILQGKISKLWRVNEYSATRPNGINSEGAVFFDVIKEYNAEYSIYYHFSRNRHFELNLNLLNKSVKQLKQGFFEITVSPNCPSPENINLDEIRNIYLAIQNPIKPINFNNGDLRVLLNNTNELKIEKVEVFNDGDFKVYQTLNDLYFSRNKSNELYTIKELLEYSKLDKATNKEKYIKSVIKELIEKGAFEVNNPIALYDNILVGRKRTSKKKDEEPEDSFTEDSVLNSEITQDELEYFQDYVDLLNFNPNLILYGPPGTGKTYSAQRIIECFEYSRTKIWRNFEELQKENRVNFVTFHQSFSYEEFIEGLRPVLSNDSSTGEFQENSNIKYKVQDGILKQIANKASISQIQKEYSTSNLKEITESSRIWKISLGRRYHDEEIYNRCLSQNVISIGWFEDSDLTDYTYEEIYNELKSTKKEGEPDPRNDANSINFFVNEMQEGDVVLVFNNRTSIRAIGIISSPYKYEEEPVKGYNHHRSTKWLKVFENPIDILKYNGGKQLNLQTVYPLERFEFSDIKELLGTDIKTETKNEVQAIPYFLIIDEINRGNISKIFGELITLIEKDKRDKIEVTLPYSQKPFKLPTNLYIVGTMNTSDRSIAILDTALRRRFIFKEIEPDASFISVDGDLVISGVNLEILLSNLNIKITDELDRDHRIGHSYFMQLRSLEDIRFTWYYQIIPLLMEYFYNDGSRIAKIVGEVFVDKKTSQVNYNLSDEEFKQALRLI